jgi:hypothetical protein
MADDKTLKGYLERAYQLGKEFTNKPVNLNPSSFKKPEQLNLRVQK